MPIIRGNNIVVMPSCIIEWLRKSNLKTLFFSLGAMHWGGCTTKTLVKETYKVDVCFLEIGGKTQASTQARLFNSSQILLVTFFQILHIQEVYVTIMYLYQRHVKVCSSRIIEACASFFCCFQKLFVKSVEWKGRTKLHQWLRLENILVSGKPKW